MPNKVVNGTPTSLRSVDAHYHWRFTEGCLNAS
jgi:hypothetical protein